MKYETLFNVDQGDAEVTVKIPEDLSRPILYVVTVCGIKMLQYGDRADLVLREFLREHEQIK